MKHVWKVLIFSGFMLLLAGMGIIICYFLAELFVHNPIDRRVAEVKTPSDYQMTYENLKLKTQDGLHLAAWYVPSKNRAVVIMVHGFKSNRTDMLIRAQMIARHGYGVLLLDLRAHGESEGDLITFGLKEVQDVDAAYQYLLTRPDVDADKIGAVGCSMGGTVVLLSAAQNPGIKAVASESTFATLKDAIPLQIAIKELPPLLFAPGVEWFAERIGGFNASQVSALDHIREISPRPVFIMQGGKDVAVPPVSGQLLYDAAGEPRELWWEPDLGHTAFAGAKPDAYEQRITAFFDRYLLGK